MKMHTPFGAFAICLRQETLSHPGPEQPAPLKGQTFPSRLRNSKHGQAMRHVWWAIVEGRRPAGRLRPRDPAPKQGDIDDFFSVGFVMGCQRAIRAIPGSAGGMLLASTAGKVAELGGAETRDEVR
ncbi:hypothetical protein E4U43_006565 [Claviceps pusilla]|uniref:Uncharacterized protein n=1 Tax=Claviceps pusilla TaxID=123648 RepID=A0A9P7SVI9_9HYPO|nr:hypothetical protein E4U43_006565 [Claviceps pusilla]